LDGRWSFYVLALSFLLWENAPVNYNRHLVNRRFLVVGGVALLMLSCASGAWAGGAYQRTDDRKKTLVWNNDPQPGDAAEWTGGRDSQGYAEGTGTLTWLQPEKKSVTGSNISSARRVPISSYTGAMTHGKFEGSVTTVDHGKTYHATYAAGQRKGRWSTGPAVANVESVESKPAEEDRPEPLKTVATTETIEPERPKVSNETIEAPAEGPTSETNAGKPAPNKTDTRLAKTEPPSGELSADESNQSATPQKPVSKKTALAPGAVRAIDQLGRQVEKKSEKPKEAPVKIKRATKVEESKVEAASEQATEPPAEGPRSAAAEKPQPPSSKTKVETSEVSQPPTPVPSQSSTTHPPPLNAQLSETPVDDSIRTLTGPPSSLRAKAPTAPADASPPAAESAPSIAPAVPLPSAEPKLNAVQAMDIADIQAREQGYDLGEYQLPKADYNATDDTWSVSYIGRDDDKSGKHLSVVVQDKSGKAQVKK
jgi:hypothetical protein